MATSERLPIKRMFPFWPLASKWRIVQPLNMRISAPFLCNFLLSQRAAARNKNSRCSKFIYWLLKSGHLRNATFTFTGYNLNDLKPSWQERKGKKKIVSKAESIIYSSLSRSLKFGKPGSPTQADWCTVNAWHLRLKVSMLILLNVWV